MIVPGTMVVIDPTRAAGIKMAIDEKKLQEITTKYARMATGKE